MADFVKAIGALVVVAGGLVLIVAGIVKSQMIAVVLGAVAFTLAAALGASRAIRKR
jgi:hypothetical protein